MPSLCPVPIIVEIYIVMNLNLLAASARKLAPNLAPQRAKLGAHLRQVVRPDLSVRGIFKGFWTSPGRNEHLEFDLRTLT